jgi:hypothetical protein
MDDQSRVTTDRPKHEDAGKTGPPKAVGVATGMFLPAAIVFVIAIVVILYLVL